MQNWNDADLDGITITGEVDASPSAIVNLFGPPSPGDGHKISGMFVFEDGEGNKFVLHDWMDTNLHTDRAPSPEEFWQIADSRPLQISGHNLDASDFSGWVSRQLGAVPGQDSRGQTVIQL